MMVCGSNFMTSSGANIMFGSKQGAEGPPGFPGTSGDTGPKGDKVRCSVTLTE